MLETRGKMQVFGVAPIQIWEQKVAGSIPVTPTFLQDRPFVRTQVSSSRSDRECIRQNSCCADSHINV
jgi:hypothetical protein